MKQYFCLGTYTDPILFGTGEVFEGKGRGVSICSFEQGEIKVLGEIRITNPSFVTIDEKKKKIYAVNETKEYLNQFGGGVTQLSYDLNANIKEERTFNTAGTDPCHIATDPHGNLLAIANFASGALTTFPLDSQGNIVDERSLFQHEGSSVHPIRQKSPHAHAAVFTQGAPYLLVPDLGNDSVVCYRYEGSTVYECPEKTFKVPAGSGPRSGVFSADGLHFYLINEISSQVTHYVYDGERFESSQCVETLPAEFTGDNICSDLHLGKNGKYLYASNRGHDSIAVFSVDEKGNLSLVQRVNCGGKTPRNFSLDNTGNYLLVGNQDSDTICVFTIGEDGLLNLQNTVAMGTPVCIHFFEHSKFSL